MDKVDRLYGQVQTYIYIVFFQLFAEIKIHGCMSSCSILIIAGCMESLLAKAAALFAGPGDPVLLRGCASCQRILLILLMQKQAQSHGDGYTCALGKTWGQS
jgi:hypothetical protein